MAVPPDPYPGPYGGYPPPPPPPPPWGGPGYVPAGVSVVLHDPARVLR